MKSLLLLIIVFNVALINAQTKKVAILDFENTSGKTEYDGLGKALSNMLITDLKNNIHPKKVQFYERVQLNKILDEQNLQKSKAFDKKTAVDFGKLAGVNFVLVGSVYVLDGKCVINSRFVDVQTSEIVHSKESNGNIKDWLQLKTTLAEELSKAISNPVTIDAQYSESVVTEGVLNQYSKVIDKIDAGDLEEAQEMSEMLSDVQPDFKYFSELQSDIEELRFQVEANTEYIDGLKTMEIEMARITDSILTSIENQKNTGVLVEDSLRLVDIYENLYNAFKDSLTRYNAKPGYRPRRLAIGSIYDWSCESSRKEIREFFQSRRFKSNPFLASKIEVLAISLKKETAIRIRNLLPEKDVPVKVNLDADR